MAFVLKLEADGEHPVDTAAELERGLYRLHAPENGFAVLARDPVTYIRARRTERGFALEHGRPPGKRFTSRREDLSHGEVMTAFRSWLERGSRWHRDVEWVVASPVRPSLVKGSPGAFTAAGLLFGVIGLLVGGDGVRERVRATDELGHPGRAMGQVTAVEVVRAKKARNTRWRTTVAYAVDGRDAVVTESVERPTHAGEAVSVYFDARTPEAGSLRHPSARRLDGLSRSGLGAVFVGMGLVFAVIGKMERLRRRARG